MTILIVNWCSLWTSFVIFVVNWCQFSSNDLTRQSWRFTSIFDANVIFWRFTSFFDDFQNFKKFAKKFRRFWLKNYDLRLCRHFLRRQFTSSYGVNRRKTSSKINVKRHNLRVRLINVNWRQKMIFDVSWRPSIDDKWRHWRQ